jgi:hypothetical protein
MNVSMRDRLATVFVATATVVYGLWLSGIVRGLPASGVAMVVLALGIVASISAVVPGFPGLLAGSKAYLVVVSLLGLVAFGSGILTVANGREDALAVLMLATVVLWAAATLRHTTLGSRLESALR